MSDTIPHLKPLSDALVQYVETTFQQSGKVTFDGDATVETKHIMEYDRRMRVSGLEKFNGPAYVAAVSFYRSEKDKVAHNACGALVLNVADQEMPKLYQTIGVTGFDDDEEDEAIEKSCEACQIIADEFLSRIQGAGYSGLLRSDAVGGRNTILDGVEFGFDQYDAYEISFVVKKQKVLAFDLTMSR